MTPFHVSGKEPFRNIVGEGENAGNPFSHNVVFFLEDKNDHLCYIYFVVCKCIQFGQVQNFVVW